MQKLKDILNKLDEIRRDAGMQIDDKTLFEQAVDIFISNNISENNKKEYLNKQNNEK
jgi:hypothetical protein